MTRADRPASGSPLRLGLGLASLALAAFLLIGFKAPDDGTVTHASGSGTSGSGTRSATGGTTGNTGTTGTSSGNGSSGSTTGSGSGSSTTGSGSSGPGSSGTAGGSAAKSGTVDGSVVDTRYGPVQVEITVSNGKVTGVTGIELPSGGRSGMISGYVAPILSSEALTAQSANIDLVSGATYTSDGYAQSLQSALDQAGL